jgi:hypothetical protein
MTESQLQDAIRLALGRDRGVLIFRNNIGHAVMRHGARVTFGVGGPGGADLIGILDGRPLAIEVKSQSGRQSTDQLRFQALWESRGGIYLMPRSVEDALAMIAEQRRRGQ